MLDRQKLRTFVLGGIAGALAGFLLAPKSGKELRGSIAARAGEARERGRETYFETQERMQERLAETRERPRRPKESPLEGEADLLPRLAPEPGPEPPAGTPPPPLRDVSQDALRDVAWLASGEDPDPEEIRQRIQETRSRLRARVDAPRPEDAPEEDRNG